MPNGHQDKSQEAELDRFFAPIANALESFAEKHNLKLERYYHDAPSWSFTFRHPKGGVGKMEVSRNADGKVQPSFMWWFDDYDTLQRHAKVCMQNELPMDPATIVTSLEAGLTLILSWRIGQWDKTYGAMTYGGKPGPKMSFSNFLNNTRCRAEEQLADSRIKLVSCG